MSDEELVRALESTQLPAGQFTHASHVRAAWWYLRHAPLAAALDRFTTSLRKYAASLGAADNYHETITVAYMLLIAERLDGAADLSWPEFAERNPDLLARTPSILSTYYSDAVLSSARAKRSFVMPDRLPAKKVTVTFSLSR